MSSQEDCPNCKTPCTDSARFCRKCGWQLRVRKPGQTPPPAPAPAPAPPKAYTPPTPADDPGGYNRPSGPQRKSHGRTIRYETPEGRTPAPVTPSAPPVQQQPPPTYTPGAQSSPPPSAWPSPPSSTYNTYSNNVPHMSPPSPPQQAPPHAPGVVTQALHIHMLDQKRDLAQTLVRSFALWAGGLTLMPIPFADLVFLIPIQSAMVLKIARIYDIDDPPEKVLSYIAAACGVSVAGQVTTVVVANFVPILGKLVSAPLVYGWTYGLGEAAVYYFENRDQLDNNHMKNIFNRVSEQARKAYAKERGKTTADESLERLRENMSPQEFEELKRRLNLR